MKNFSKLKRSKVALVAISALLLTLAGCSDNLEGTENTSKDFSKVEISKEGKDDTPLEPTPEKDAREKDAREEDNTDEVKNEIDNEVDKIVTFKKEEDETTSLVTYYVDKNDIVVKHDMKISIPYDIMGADSVDVAKEMMAPVEDNFLNIPGITHKLDYQSDQFVETISIDYSKADMLDFIGLGVDLSESVNDQTGKIEISFSENARRLEEQGYVEVE